MGVEKDRGKQTKSAVQKFRKSSKIESIDEQPTDRMAAPQPAPIAEIRADRSDDPGNTGDDGEIRQGPGDGDREGGPVLEGGDQPKPDPKPYEHVAPSEPAKLTVEPRHEQVVESDKKPGDGARARRTVIKKIYYINTRGPHARKSRSVPNRRKHVPKPESESESESDSDDDDDSESEDGSGSEESDDSDGSGEPDRDSDTDSDIEDRKPPRPKRSRVDFDNDVQTRNIQNAAPSRVNYPPKFAFL